MAEKQQAAYREAASDKEGISYVMVNNSENVARPVPGDGPAPSWLRRGQHETIRPADLVSVSLRRA